MKIWSKESENVVKRIWKCGQKNMKMRLKEYENLVNAVERIACFWGNSPQGGFRKDCYIFPTKTFASMITYFTPRLSFSFSFLVTVGNLKWTLHWGEVGWDRDIYLSFWKVRFQNPTNGQSGNLTRRKYSKIPLIQFRNKNYKGNHHHEISRCII